MKFEQWVVWLLAEPYSTADADQLFRADHPGKHIGIFYKWRSEYV